MWKYIGLICLKASNIFLFKNFKHFSPPLPTHSFHSRRPIPISRYSQPFPLLHPRCQSAFLRLGLSAPARHFFRSANCRIYSPGCKFTGSGFGTLWPRDAFQALKGIVETGEAEEIRESVVLSTRIYIFFLRLSIVWSQNCLIILQLIGWIWYVFFRLLTPSSEPK